MIAVADGVAVVVAVLAVMATTAWAAQLSVRAAAAGPEWALGHLARTRWFLIVLPAAGAVAFLLVEPRWMGLVVGYVGAVGALLAWMLARNLGRLRDAGGFDEVPVERRRQIVTIAKRRLTRAGLVLVALGAVLVISGAGGPGLVTAGMGGSLAATALAIAVPAA